MHRHKKMLKKMRKKIQVGSKNSTPFFKGQHIKDLKCTDISNLGYGVFKHNGYTIFALNALVNERVDIELFDIKRKYAIGRITTYHTRSENRVDMKQAHVLNANRYINVDYETQVKIKEAQMTKLFNQPVTLKQANQQFNYRNKSEFFYANHKLNMIDDKHQYQPIKTCVLSHPAINTLLPLIEEALNNHPRAQISSVIIRHSAYEDKSLIIFVSKIENRHQDKIAQEIIGATDTIKGIVLNVGASDNYLFNDKEVMLYGEDYLIEKLMNKQFKLTSKSFYQINQEQTVKLYETIIDFAQFKRSDNVADLYCGVGTIGIIISDYVNSVIGIEVVSDAVKAAQDNIDLNEIHNVSIVEHDLNEDLSVLENIDVAIVDPPRNGLSKTIIDNIAKSEIKKVVYVSCNPYSQKEDLKYFEAYGYHIDKIQAVDMFINTHHVESVMLLSHE